MKFYVFTLLFFLTTCSFASAQEMTPLDEFKRIREMQEKSFRNPQGSPILSSELKDFHGLDYFDFAVDFRIKAVFTETTERKIFYMPTSTGGSRKYLKTGILQFKINDREYSLGVFKPETQKKDEIDLFIPFRDLTNGKETYEAGRYLYVRKPKKGSEVILDFNWSQNPFCAYGNSSFACTLPPKENYLQVEIRAGEKKYISPKKPIRVN